MGFSKVKKNLAIILGGILISVNFISCSEGSNTSAKGEVTASPNGVDITADKAIELLEAGNERFVNGNVKVKDISDERREELNEKGQFPYAVVVSCSDSRVPTELIFDEGLGNIFTIRNAGNVIDDITLGSVEYGAEHLGAPLIVVLGHEKCGAVKATVDGGQASENIEEIKSLIKPSYEEAKKETTDEKEVYTMTEDLNIKNSMEAIENSEVIKQLIEENKVKVIGAKYSLDDGKVTFID